MDALEKWTKATSEIPWGVQRALKETLQAVADEQVTLAWGTDYNNANPCLINAAATMLKAIGGEGGHGKPGMFYSGIVLAFDEVNQELFNRGVNTHHIVSPLAAEVLVANFAELRPEPEIPEAVTPDPVTNEPYLEVSDEQLTRDWLKALNEECEVESNVEAHQLSVSDPNTL